MEEILAKNREAEEAQRAKEEAERAKQEEEERKTREEEARKRKEMYVWVSVWVWFILGICVCFAMGTRPCAPIRVLGCVRLCPFEFWVRVFASVCVKVLATKGVVDWPDTAAGGLGGTRQGELRLCVSVCLRPFQFWASFVSVCFNRC